MHNVNLLLCKMHKIRENLCALLLLTGLLKMRHIGAKSETRRAWTDTAPTPDKNRYRGNFALYDFHFQKYQSTTEFRAHTRLGPGANC